MAKFKDTDIQKVGSVEVSASKLRALATKIEEVYKTAENVEVDMYLVPSGAKKTFAFDFEPKETKPSEQPAGSTPEVKPAEAQPATPAPAEVKPAEAKPTEVKPAETPATPEQKPAEQKPTEEKK